jgi:Ca2+-binding EF-hand superfamily protein
MINYNSIIDSFTSRTHNFSPSYLSTKPANKTKPKSYFHHKFESHRTREQSISPLISVQKKPLNVSPRRTININLRLINPELPARIIQKYNESAAHRISASFDFPKAPRIVSSFRHRPLPVVSPALKFSPTPISRDYSQSLIEGLKIVKAGKGLSRNSSLCIPRHGLYQEVIQFQQFIEARYRKMYEEIDVAQKGFITVDDFINLVMFIDIINGSSEDDFEFVKGKAEEILSIFAKVSSTAKVSKKEFYALCSLYEHVKPNSDSMNLLDIEVRTLLLQKIDDFEQIFMCYAKAGRIKFKDLHNILVLLKLSDLQPIEGMLYLEVIDFAFFLRFLPLFSWVHDNVIKSMEVPN